MKFTQHLCFFLILFCSCANHAEKENPQQENYLPQKMKYAKGLHISKIPNSNYKIEIYDTQDSSVQLATYILTTERVIGNNDSIHIPIESAALNSTTFVTYFDALRSIYLVKGLSYADQVKNANMGKQLEAGNAKEITSGGEIDFEKVLSVHPDIFMAYSYGDSDFSRLVGQGIPVIINMEYRESHPLGRAEWIKLVGCLTGKETLADSIFNNLDKKYNALKAEVAFLSYSPSVFTGSMYNDLWYAPGGDSYISKFIADAGAQYVFQEKKGIGNVELDYEVALKSLIAADFWGLVIFQENEFTAEDLSEIAPQFRTYNSFEKGNVFYCNAAQSDYFGEAVLEPHFVLADLIAIFHPALLPDHAPKYFRALN